MFDRLNWLSRLTGAIKKSSLTHRMLFLKKNYSNGSKKLALMNCCIGEFRMQIALHLGLGESRILQLILAFKTSLRISVLEPLGLLDSIRIGIVGFECFGNFDLRNIVTRKRQGYKLSAALSSKIWNPNSNFQWTYSILRPTRYARRCCPVIAVS